MLVFLGVEEADGPEDTKWLASKIPSLRVFEDEDNRMNRSVLDTAGEILTISQFTLYGNVRKGTRPSFNHAACPEKGNALYEAFVENLAQHLGKSVKTGIFGAHMQIEALNDGPVTLVIDTKNKKF